VARLQSAFLANAAQLEQTGLLSVLGAFIDSVAGPQLPVRQQIWVVGRFEVTIAEASVAHPVSVIVERADGTEQVARMDVVLSAADELRLATFDPDLPIATPLVAPMPLEFRRTGLYLVRIVIDDVEMAALPLRVGTANPQS
jgi:hypothetical protein